MKRGTISHSHHCLISAYQLPSSLLVSDQHSTSLSFNASSFFDTPSVLYHKQYSSQVTTKQCPPSLNPLHFLHLLAAPVPVLVLFQGPWYLTHKVPYWLTVSGQVLHSTASNIDCFKCSASTPRPLPHLPWLASLPLQLSTNLYNCNCKKWHCSPFLGILLGLWPLKMKVLWSVKMSGITPPHTDCHIPQNLYPETQGSQV